MSGKKQTCGRCGRSFGMGKNRRFNSLCPDCRVPHQHMTKDEDGTWSCVYCGQMGSIAMLRSTDCTHDYPKCEACGLHPYCAPDCPGVIQALGLGF